MATAFGNTDAPYSHTATENEQMSSESLFKLLEISLGGRNDA